MKDRDPFSLGQQASNRTYLEQQAPFAESCLPSTMALAKQNRTRILPLLDNPTRKFPFEDRVLIWLHAIWQEDVENFHRSNGKGMAETFNDATHKLRKFDDYYLYYLEKLRDWLRSERSQPRRGG